MSVRALLAASALLLGATTGSAALTWLSTTFEGATQPLQKTLDVAFSFKNTGDRPVTIRHVQTNCDCLVAGADRQIYQPGEAGVVTARFAVGDRVGTYERGIAVATDDGSPAQHLRVRIEVPEPATVSPATREWSIAGGTAEQTVDVTVAPELTINFREVFVSSESFQARFETLEPGRRYRIHVRPVATAEAASAAIRLIGQAQSGDDVVVSAYAYVR